LWCTRAGIVRCFSLPGPELGGDFLLMLQARHIARLTKKTPYLLDWTTLLLVAV
jgi:hypothetical protein